MRNTFIKVLSELAREDDRIVLLTGDLGYSVFEGFAQEFPKRFHNFGISEQNMTGAAAGLALYGKKAISYSIATFATMRPFEQIRVDIAFQRANVIIVGVGGGLAYGSLGPTHHATEDIAIMRSLPNMVVLCPGDQFEAAAATRAAIAHDGPVYLRLGKGKEPAVHSAEPTITIGKALTLRDGDGITIISTGDGLKTAATAVERLVSEGIDVRFLSMPCVKPIDRDAILSAASTSHIITVEEHQADGGLGGAVAETLAELPAHAPLTRIGINDRFIDHAGSQDHLRERCGITVDAIASAGRSRK